MASENNIIVTADNEPVKKFAKAIPSKLAGRRLDPFKFNELSFVLESDPEIGFLYENDVIELYNDREVRFFLHANRKFIKEGYLKEYQGSPTVADTSNILSDEEVETIATLRTGPMIAKRLNDLTSRVAVQRVLDMAQHVGRPASIIKIIEKRMQELQ